MVQKEEKMAKTHIATIERAAPICWSKYTAVIAVNLVFCNFFLRALLIVFENYYSLFHGLWESVEYCQFVMIFFFLFHKFCEYFQPFSLFVVILWMHFLNSGQKSGPDKSKICSMFTHSWTKVFHLFVSVEIMMLVSQMLLFIT